MKLALALLSALSAPAPQICPATMQDAEAAVAGLESLGPNTPPGDTPTAFVYDGKGGAPVWGQVPRGYGVVRQGNETLALIQILPVMKDFDYPRALREGMPGNIAPQCSGPLTCRWTPPTPSSKQALRSIALTPSKDSLLLSCYYGDPPKRPAKP